TARCSPTRRTSMRPGSGSTMRCSSSGSSRVGHHVPDKRRAAARAWTGHEESKRVDRKIAQPQIGETALLPQAEQRPVEGEPQRVVAALHRDPDALAEIAAFGERAALELAAIGRVGAVEPEGELDAVAEQEIDLAAAQRIAGGLDIGIGARL